MGHSTPVTAPFLGVVTPLVTVGDRVLAGDVLASIEAMKMEAAVTAPCAGTVRRVAVVAGSSVQGGDLLLEI
ncbi:biotin/lipoyl-containing protein [Nocardioides sp. AE5]|uniref:biotin/lipoyl-containing protein n=1 Tax=Nocardioides sp. AE5 TaxID=2962573 RepID=UPI0028817A39|nr:biotin/lipoyl-containing protein [Nocardioides sp. AE5]MDT0201925.1 biotin/lipoyl-containing protein [Nocardioides sp. AE5]